MNGWLKDLLRIVVMSDWIKDLLDSFGIVHDSASIKYMGEDGLLVWDYIIWNELTFVDARTRTKQSLFERLSDKETKEKFDDLVRKYGT